MAKTPTQTMADIIDARQALDFDRAALNYADYAIIVAAPGKPAHGRKAVGDGFRALSVAFPTFAITAREVIENGDLALHLCTWHAEGPDASGKITAASGKTADVLQRQPNGNWLVIIDNPWGTALLVD